MTGWIAFKIMTEAYSKTDAYKNRALMVITDSNIHSYIDNRKSIN